MTTVPGNSASSQVPNTVSGKIQTMFHGGRTFGKDGELWKPTTVLNDLFDLFQLDNFKKPHSNRCVSNGPQGYDREKLASISKCAAERFLSFKPTSTFERSS